MKSFAVGAWDDLQEKEHLLDENDIAPQITAGGSPETSKHNIYNIYNVKLFNYIPADTSKHGHYRQLPSR